MELLFADPPCLVCDDGDKAQRQALVLHFRQPTAQPRVLSDALPADGSQPRTTETAFVGQQPQQLTAMLFDGATLVARYSWPLPPASEASSTFTTAALVPPCISSPRALQLILVRCPAAEQSTSTSSSSSSSSSASQLSSVAFARLPLLFLPPQAQQEVELVLLPSMRQELAAGAAAADPRAVADATASGSNCSTACAPLSSGTPSSPFSSSSRCQEATRDRRLPIGADAVSVHAAAWSFWSALADDIGQLLGFAAGSGTQQPDVVLRYTLPVVLGFLQQHSLQQLLGVVQHALKQAAGQQAPRMLPRSTPAHPARGRAAAAAIGARQAQQRHCAPQAAAAPRDEPPVAAAIAQPSMLARSAAGAEAEEALPQLLSSRMSCKERRPSHESSSSHGLTAYEHPSSPVKSGSQQQQDPAAATPAAAAAAPGPQLSWRSPWQHFPVCQEKAYVAWKQQHHLWVDRYTAWFIVLHFVALVLRMLWERDVRGTALYLYFVGMRLLPYAPLVLGKLQVFYRQREASLGLAGQLLSILPIVVHALLCDSRLPALLSKWALPMADALVGPLLAGQLNTSSSSSSGGGGGGSGSDSSYAASDTSCAWSLPLCCAAGNGNMVLAWCTGVCGVLVVPASAMRAFWRARGELLVIGLAPLMQPLRLHWQLLGSLIEAVSVGYAFSLLCPLQQVALRYTAAVVLSLVVGWASDMHYRAAFCRHLHLAQQSSSKQPQLKAGKAA